MTGIKTNSGNNLSKQWKVNVVQSHFHKEGTWFHTLDHFPAGLFDSHNFVLFRTEEDYQNCAYIRIGQHINVPKGISSIPGYKKMR